MSIERDSILKDLGLAEQHIGQGEHQLRMQRQTIAQLRRAGQDAVEAEALLKSGEQAQKLHFADRSRLLRELSASNPQR